MITPQLTEQYGHVERVSLARAIFSVRSCANAGFRSNPKTAAAAPPMVANFRKSRRVGLMLGPPSAGEQGREHARRCSLIIHASRSVKKEFRPFRRVTEQRKKGIWVHSNRIQIGLIDLARSASCSRKFAICASIRSWLSVFCLRRKSNLCRVPRLPEHSSNRRL